MQKIDAKLALLFFYTKRVVSLIINMGNENSQPDDDTQEFEDIEIGFATKYIDFLLRFETKYIDIHKMPMINYNHILHNVSNNGDDEYFQEDGKYITYNKTDKGYYFCSDLKINGKIACGAVIPTDIDDYKIVKMFFKLIQLHNLPIVLETNNITKYNLHFPCPTLNKILKSTACLKMQELLQYTPDSINNAINEIAHIDNVLKDKRNIILQNNLSNTQIQDIIDECILLKTHRNELERVVETYNTQYKSPDKVDKQIHALQHFISRLRTGDEFVETVAKSMLPVENALIHLPDVPVAVPIIYPTVPTNEIIAVATVETVENNIDAIRRIATQI